MRTKKLSKMLDIARSALLLAGAEERTEFVIIEHPEVPTVMAYVEVPADLVGLFRGKGGANKDAIEAGLTFLIRAAGKQDGFKDVRVSFTWSPEEVARGRKGKPPEKDGE